MLVWFDIFHGVCNVHTCVLCSTGKLLITKGLGHCSQVLFCFLFVWFGFGLVWGESFFVFLFLFLFCFLRYLGTYDIDVQDYWHYLTISAKTPLKYSCVGVLIDYNIFKKRVCGKGLNCPLLRDLQTGLDSWSGRAIRRDNIKASRDTDLSFLPDAGAKGMFRWGIKLHILVT